MFIENQTVWCAMFGKGVVARINPKGAKFPVVVKFDGLMERCYSLEGKYEQLYATQPTLFPYPIEIVKKVTKPSIDWSHVSEEFQYLAMDENGRHHLFAVKPTLTASEWTMRALYTEAGHFASFIPGTCDWKDSLVERTDSA